MAIFNSYVKLPEGTKKKCWGIIIFPIDIAMN